MNFALANRKQKRIISVFLYAFALIWLFPFYTAIRNSLKVNGFQNYVDLFTSDLNGISLIGTFWNSALIAIGSTFLLLSIGALAAFAFSKLRFFAKEAIYVSVLLCLAVPGVVILIPFYYILKNLDLYNTLWAVIFSEAVLTLPFAVLMLRNYYDNLPPELMESASIDGASKLQAFIHIYLPLSIPALINLGVLSIMWSFQDFLLPLMFLTDKSVLTATVAVNTLKGLFGFSPADLGKFNAALVVLGMPGVVIFTFARKFITSGITSGAVKD
ncbi:carbohydrate ABC transporter permease [Bacillus sp. FJAT-28004]|uniref:carbohydrate ABC transporter permease n=1 Tax=Bacillus sp. FJAT-28004 TaxID=1679165 RepID=UPI0006B60FEC|nr:carbohydrate ABC transporter permease [Bacillus sp. FJAT-28004]